MSGLPFIKVGVHRFNLFHVVSVEGGTATACVHFTNGNCLNLKQTDAARFLAFYDALADNLDVQIKPEPSQEFGGPTTRADFELGQN